MHVSTKVRILHSCVWLAVAAGALTMPGSTVWAQCDQNCPEKRTISVAGFGTVTTDADYAMVHVGYKIFGPDAKTAFASASDVSNAIMQALTESGIDKKAIESTSQIIQHTQPYERGYQPNTEEYKNREIVVSQSWVIRASPDDAGKVLNTAIRAGANESGWIQWMVEDQSTLEAQASAKAVANARAIAEQVAQKSNVHIGHLVTLNENQNQMMGQYPGTIMMNGNLMPMAAAAGSVQVGNDRLPVNSRRVVIAISVYAQFSIE